MDYHLQLKLFVRQVSDLDHFINFSWCCTGIWGKKLPESGCCDAAKCSYLYFVVVSCFVCVSQCRVSLANPSPVSMCGKVCACECVYTHACLHALFQADWKILQDCYISFTSELIVSICSVLSSYC